MREDSPCHGCTERFLACSDRCPKDKRGEYGHKAWLNRIHAQKKDLKETGNRWSRPWSASQEKRHRKEIQFSRYGY